MDWIRRNWPDLLIGVALVAVIVMIVATLLSGGSLLSLIRRDAPAEPQPSAVTAPLGPTETAEGDVEPGTEAGSPEAGAEDASGDAETSTETGTETASADTADAEAGDIDPFIPEVGSPQTGGETLVAEGTAEDGTDEDATGDDLAGDAAGAAEQAPQDADGAPSEAVSTGGLYRVAAGAIGTQEGATTLAQSYRSEGYQVSVEPQGDLFLLWVGPYESEADAESAAQSIRDAGGDALVYSFGGAAPPADGEAAEDDALGEGDTDAADVAGEGTDDDGAATNTGAGGPSTGEEATEAELADVDEGEVPDPEVEAPELETPEAGTPETETEVETELGAATVETTAVATATDTGADTGVADAPTSPGSAALGDTGPETTAPETTGPESAATGDASGLPSAPAGQRYLQVGAFVSEASSEPLRAQLENLDFEVTSSETATGLTRLYIGPFDEAQLQEAQTELTAQGLDSFPVAR